MGHSRDSGTIRLSVAGCAANVWAAHIGHRGFPRVELGLRRACRKMLACPRARPTFCRAYLGESSVRKRSMMLAVAAAALLPLTSVAVASATPHDSQQSSDQESSSHKNLVAPVDLNRPASPDDPSARSYEFQYSASKTSSSSVTPRTGGCWGETYKPTVSYVPPSTITYITYDAKQWCTGDFLHQKVRVVLQKYYADPSGPYWSDVTLPIDGRDTAGSPAYAQGSIRCSSVGSGAFRTRATGTVWPASSAPISRTGYSASVNITC